MKLPASLKDQGISQDMVTTLSEIAAFRRNEYPRPSSSRNTSSSDDDAAPVKPAGPEQQRRR